MNIMETSHTENTGKDSDGYFCSDLPRTMMHEGYIYIYIYILTL